VVLATAQAQGKALSLKPSIIMGAIASDGRVKNFSSYWNHSYATTHTFLAPLNPRTQATI